MRLKVRPLTPDDWAVVETLFGAKGACGGCWCMYWRLHHAQFEKQKGEKNRLAMKRLVTSGIVPGIIAYHKNEPVGWCSVGPRSDFVRLEKSRIFRPVDEQPVWSINCLFVAGSYRNMGISSGLIAAAVDYARRKKAKIVEGYPFEPQSGKQPDPFVWTGLASSYFDVGFKEVARRSPTRPVVRFTIK